MGDHHLVVDVIAPGDFDRLVAGLHVEPLPVELVLSGVIRVEPLDEQVLSVGGLIGHAPGDPLVVPDDDPWRAGE